MTELASSSTPAPAGPGSLGRYAVLDVLGRGAMGVVYKAHDPLLDRAVAIKVVTTDLLGAEERADYLDRFTREARAAARCTHRGIVAVHDFSQSDGNPFIVMELVVGTELGHFIRERGRLPLSEAVALMKQMLDALGHAHGLGIVHRDIKPANVLVLPGAEVKIADFGIARLGDVSSTQVGAIVGTPKYMAPEQARGGTVDHRADLFSAASVFYEMLAGTPPFTGATPDEIMGRIIYGEPSGLDEASLRAHPGLGPLLQRALAKDPAQRFPSASALAAALQDIVVGVAAPPAQDDMTRISVRTGALDARAVGAVESALTTHIGPIARVVVRKASATATSEAEFYQAVAEAIPDESARAAFLRGYGAASSTVTVARTEPTPPRGAPVAAEAMREAQEALTYFVGPIARVLVRRAADRARTADEFYTELMTHLASEADRTAFRRQVRKDWDPRIVR
jgi:serine/threonine-protein kinase